MEMDANVTMHIETPPAWERNQMMRHDSLSALRHENEQLECQLMAMEDERTREYQDIQWYCEQDQQGNDVPMEPGGHIEPTDPGEPADPIDPGEPADPTDPDDPLGPRGPEGAGPSAPEPPAVPQVRATKRHRGYDAWSNYWDHYGKPYQNAPWRDMSKASASHPTSTPASSSTSALAATTSKAKAMAKEPAVPKTRPSENKVTGWRAKMAYILVLYENHQWAKIDELIQGQEDAPRNHPDHNQGWKSKALKWITNWKAQQWHNIEQYHEWCLGPKISTFTKYVICF